MGKILELREKGKTLRGNIITSLFWNIAGADVPLLKMCPTDQSKYTALGGAITLCSILVGVCSAHFVHSLSGNTLFTILCGILVALMFFFIYRMAISTMYSDGKSSVSPQEIKSAIPSVILSIAVGVFMSTTIEMAIFEGQIEKELDTECKDFVASIVDEEKQSMDAEIEALNRNLDELSSQMKVEESSIIGKQRPVIAKGPHWIAIKAKQDSLTVKISALKEANQMKITKMQAEESERFMNNVDFAKRVEAMYNVSSWAVNPTLGFIRMFISLIFIVILISPIISKMMLEDGAYEQLVTKLSDEIKAEVDGVVSNDTNDKLINED